MTSTHIRDTHIQRRLNRKVEADRSYSPQSKDARSWESPGQNPSQPQNQLAHTPDMTSEAECSIWLYFLIIRLCPTSSLSSEPSVARATLGRESTSWAIPDGAPISHMWGKMSSPLPPYPTSHLVA